MPKNNKLLLGLPSKGRLKEQCEEYLSKIGMKLRQLGGDRGYSAHIIGENNIEVRLMSSSEIAKSLLSGELHTGITGEDLLREQSAKCEELLEFAIKLGFGKADVVVAVPDGWIDVDNMRDLEEVCRLMRIEKGKSLKIATKFTRITSEFFHKNGIIDYRIVYSGGATEGAPANGIAEAIVDISTSGATLSANNLKILDDGLILQSEANLVKSKVAKWNESIEIEFQKLLQQIS